MKRLLEYLFLVLVLIFSLQSWSKADDIRDFQIEGMSIGDSLLDYFSEKEIKSNTNYNGYSYIKEKKFVDFEIYEKNRFDKYDGVQIAFDRNDNQYLIHSISAGIFYKEISICYSDMTEVTNQIKLMFKNIETDLNKKLDHPEKKGTALSNWFNLEEGSISVMCTDWNKEVEQAHGWSDSMRVEIRTNEFERWIQN